MGLLDLWKRLFSANKNTLNSTRRREKSKISTKKAVRKTQHKTKTVVRKSSKTTTKKGEVNKKIPVKIRKRVKKSHAQSRVKTDKKAYQHTKKLGRKQKERLIGLITHYFGKVNAGVVKLKAPLKVGDKIHIKGAHDDFTQIVSSMQINRKDVSSAGKGKEVGIRVIKPVHANDKVYFVRD